MFACLIAGVCYSVLVNAFSCHAVNVYMFLSLAMTKPGMCWPATTLSWALRGMKSIGTSGCH